MEGQGLVGATTINWAMVGRCVLPKLPRLRVHCTLSSRYLRYTDGSFEQLDFKDGRYFLGPVK